MATAPCRVLLHVLDAWLDADESSEIYKQSVIGTLDCALTESKQRAVAPSLQSIGKLLAGTRQPESAAPAAASRIVLPDSGNADDLRI